MLDSYGSILKDLPAELAEDIRANGTLVRARRGSDVISPGDSSDQVFVLLDGRVQTRLFAPDGSEAILRDLEPGAMFGEIAAIDGGPRSAWVGAQIDCVLVRLPADRFRAAIIGLPAVADWMARRLAAQIRDLTHRWFELNALQVRSRLHCELARMCGDSAEPVTLDPAPSHAELAARIGTHREAVTREIGYLAKSGILEHEGKRRRLTISDPAALKKLAEVATWSDAG
jgi:CRP/FNR family transcriptional regulator, cyclic AMP receptor protein